MTVTEFPGRSFTISRYFSFSYAGQIWDRMVHLWKVLKPGGCQVGGLHLKMLSCNPWLSWSQNEIFKLFSRPARGFDLLRRLCTLQRYIFNLKSQKARVGKWNTTPHSYFAISLHRLKNPSHRIRVGCVPKQKSINILVKTLYWSGSGKICIKMSKQTLLPNGLV